MGAIAALAGCGADVSRSDPSESAPAALAPTPAVRGRVEALRERVGIRDSTAVFEPSGMESIRAVIPPEAKHGVARTASVELPRHATGFATVEDDASQLSVRFALRDAEDAPIAVAHGMALYAGALVGADVVHRPHAEGTEDFIVFETQPAEEELSYIVDVSRVAGLRLVDSTLEFLDDAGSPRLRIAPPYVVDADGERHSAKLTVEECAYDDSPAAPWGRPVTNPDSALCTVRVAWERVLYPAVVDPAWTATGSMAEARSGHTASLLASGKVLVAGGLEYVYGGLATAELYDPATGTFAATGSMAQRRHFHTASVLSSGKVLVAGSHSCAYGVGASACYVSATAELYDPAAGTFSATGSMATARGMHSASVLSSGKVLVAGGLVWSGHGGAGVTIASAELYDPAAGMFSATGPMAVERGGHTASVLPSGEVLVAGGMDSGSSAELYDPVAGVFSVTHWMTQMRRGHTASVLPSGKVLITGGDLATAELYDRTARTFLKTGSMAEVRAGHTASVLASGEVLVVGGGRATAELYDPAAGTFSAAGSMAEARSAHTASVLASGDVLVAGGDFRARDYFASAELYRLSGIGGGGSDQGGAAPVGGASPGVGGAAASDGDADIGGGCSCREARSPSQAPIGAFVISLAIGAWRRRRAQSASATVTP